MSITIVMETVDNQGYSLPCMEPGARIKQAREAKGWSQADLGRRVGISQPAIKKVEDGGTRQSKYLPAIVMEVGLDLAELYPELAKRPSAEPFIPERQLMTAGRDFPIHAAAEGGPGQIVVSADPVDFMPRPVPLANTHRAYGLLIVGSSMEPEYRQGDTALVNPNLPVIGGEVYIFYAEREGEARATIKHLRRATEDKWQVVQHNPAPGANREFSLSRKEWQWAHRVIGKYSRF